MKLKKLALLLTLVVTIPVSATTYAATIDNSSESIKSIDTEITDPNEIREYVKTNFAENSRAMNELDYIKQIQSYTLEDLIEYGYTVEEAEEILNHDYNQDLIEMSKKSDKSLKEEGYSSSQIDSIKSYDGSIDAVTYAQINDLSDAELDLYWGPTLINNTNQFNIYYDAEWTSAPIFHFKDIVAIGWVACNKSSIPISMKHKESPSCFVQYYMGNSYLGMRDFSSSATYTSASATLKFPVSDPGAISEGSYAKTISGSIRLETQSGSNNLSTIQIAMGYGHTVINIGSPSVSFSFPAGISVGITFSYQLEDLYNVLRTYNYDGSEA